MFRYSFSPQQNQFYWPINPNTGRRTSLRIPPQYDVKNHGQQLKILEKLPGWDGIAQQMSDSWRKKCEDLKAGRNISSEAQSHFESILNEITLENGETILMLAARNGHVDLVKHLLNLPEVDVFAEKIIDDKNALTLAVNAGEHQIADLIRDKFNLLLVKAIKQIQTMEKLPGWNDIERELTQIRQLSLWNESLTTLKSWMELPPLEQRAKTEDIYQTYRNMLAKCIREYSDSESEDYTIWNTAVAMAQNGQYALIKGFLSLPQILTPQYMYEHTIDKNVVSLFLAHLDRRYKKRAIFLDGIENLEGWDDLAQQMGGKNWLDKFFASRTWATSSVIEKYNIEGSVCSKRDQFIRCFNNITPALIFATSKGYKDLVARLCSFMPYRVNDIDQNNQTALMVACANKNYDIIKLLVNSRLDPNLRDKTTSTALMIAVANGDSHAVSLLLENPKLDLSIENKAGMTALDIAVEKAQYLSLNSDTAKAHRENYQIIIEKLEQVANKQSNAAPTITEKLTVVGKEKDKLCSFQQHNTSLFFPNTKPIVYTSAHSLNLSS